jgi:4'-phosphopantetheinyl transferase
MPGIALATVDIWRAQLALPPDQCSQVSRCLDEQEQARAVRFHFDRDRDRFLVARGLLRHILARYLDADPGRLRFGYTREGKPFLLEHRDLHFNLSHAASELVLGVARGCELGVDIEGVFSERVMHEVSGTVLSRPEQVAFQGLDAGQRRDWFVRLWTRKEAYIKADGRGMSLPLGHIDVATRPDRVRLLDDGSDDWALSRRWVLRELTVASGYAAALATEGLDAQVAYHHWPSDAG